MLEYVVSNTNLGIANSQTGNSAAYTPVEVFNFPLTYFGAKVFARVGTVGLGGTGGNSQVQEFLIAQNGTDSTITMFATVGSTTLANVGLFSTSINSTAVAVLFKPTSSNTNVKALVQLIK